MKRDRAHPFLGIPLHLAIICLVVCVLFVVSCDGSISFSGFSFLQRPPRKSQLLTELDSHFVLIDGAIVSRSGEDITITFEKESVTPEDVLTLLSKLFSAFDSVTQTWMLTIQESSSDVANRILETLQSFDSLLKEEIPYRLDVTYRDYPFTLEGEFVFYGIYAKMRLPQEVADSFRQLYSATLALNPIDLNFNEVISILRAIDAYNQLPSTVKTELAQELETLLNLRDQIYEGASVEEKQLIALLEAMEGSTLEVRIPYTELDQLPSRSVVFNGNQIGLDTDLFTVIFKDHDNKTITSLDFSDGATTFVVQMEASIKGSDTEPLLTAEVIYKATSVILSDDPDTLYTIEEALTRAESHDVYVLHDTSFASSSVANKIYGGTNHIVKSRTTLVLPYNNTQVVDFNGAPADNQPVGPISKTGREYVRLHLPEDISISVKGKLVVGAQRGAMSTLYQGHVTGNQYAVLTLDQGSSVTVEHRGELYALGFIEGEGRVEVNSGGTVYEGMFISSFRGGTITKKIHSKAFPFDQFTLMQIESPLTIHNGGSYVAKVQVWVSQTYNSGDFILVGPSALIQLGSGATLKKSFSRNSGDVTFMIAGNGSLNNGRLEIDTISTSTAGRAMPFDGRWHFVVKSGHVQINSIVALLPGSSFTIQPNASVTVAQDGGLIIFDEDFYTDYIEYPNTGGEDYYRNTTTFGYKEEDRAVFTNNGTLTVNGNIGGWVQGIGNTKLVPDEPKNIEYTFVTKDAQGNAVTVPTPLAYH